MTDQVGVPSVPDLAGSRADRSLADSIDDLRPLHHFCRDGRLYDVERWIAEGKPLQLSPSAAPKGTRPKTALQTALETGQHSLAVLLLRNGYRLELERYRPLDKALEARRWDLFELLLEHGGNFKDVDVYTLLNTYNAELYERFRAAGYDLTERHEMAAILGDGTRNRPLVARRRRNEEREKRGAQPLRRIAGILSGNNHETVKHVPTFQPADRKVGDHQPG